MRAAIYVRVSTAEQSKKFSLKAQEQDLRRYADEEGLEVVRVYADQCSGMHWEGQTELMELIQAAERGDFGIVVVTERDRLTRDPDGASILKYIFAKKGVRLAVLNEPELRSKNPSEELIDGIISLIARYESQIRLVRVRRGMDLAVKSGKDPGKAPLGYVNTPDGLKIDREGSALVRHIFGEYAAGKSIHALSKQTSFNPSKVHYILNNPAYIGRLRWRGGTVAGAHPPLISRELWERARGRSGLASGGSKQIKGRDDKD